MCKTRFINVLIIFMFVAQIIPCEAYFYNQNDILEDSWIYYKKTFLSESGRIIDPQRDHITTSEGQSYALLRSLMINDRNTFKKVYTWTNENLKRKQDNLYSWLWGLRADNTYGIIDENSATDADIDIAFALILASKVWNNQQYLDDAKKIISDIWEYETKTINNQRILISGVVQGKSTDIEINPSYFAPYAFRLFQKYDQKHDWNKIINSSYFLLEKITQMTGSKLPPDWFFINSKTGEIYLDEKLSNKNNFSYDAIRTFLRFYIDYVITQDEKAEKFLSKTGFFIDKWKKHKNGQFYTHFNQYGEVFAKYEDVGTIALLLPAIKVKNEKLAKEIYKKKVKKYYKKKGYWQEPQNYYTQNLVWLGMWIYLYEKDAKQFIEQTYNK